MAGKLTALAIEKMQPSPARREVPDGLVAGLYLVVQPSGAKSWACRYRAAGAPRKLTLGKYPGIDLKAARELAQRALVDAAGGKDPAADKQAARIATKAPADRNTIERVVDTFIERYARPNTRPSSAKEYERVLRKEVVSRWRGRLLSAIGRADVHEMLDDIVDRGSPVQANRTLAAFRKLCAWAVDRGLVTESPCTGIKPPSAENSRDRVLVDHELRLIWKAADGLGYPSGPMAQLLMLTGQRRTEVAGMARTELDMDAALWTIPRARAKNAVQHAVPLSPQCLAILSDMPRIGDRFVFTTNTRAAVSGFSQMKAALDRRVTALNDGQPLPHWTFHDLRRSTATGMARLGIALPVIERALNHVSGSFRGIVSVYQKHEYGDEKRHALDAWGVFVERLVSTEEGANVLEMKARA